MNQVCYDSLNRQAEALLDGESNMIAAMANFSALINQALPELNWVGFYIKEGEQLVLGPFQGKVACARIPWGKGVCGVSAATDTSLRVDDVHQFEGHIACDSVSNAEMVIPLHSDGQVIAVLDIDSPRYNRFNMNDQLGLEKLVKTLEIALFA
ncbi:MAG: GAF domain-containing protein [Shewanella sp.]|nr:GAF domain-containing protein [Shewanella sp.]MCF1430425.1 GAF domain-containing protein [Shewanella sp.]MCF1437326.1 GAF domain-containing protein [Shewanella sp.]MCF1456941.1 GAF domain-containing protein [Shewanella sp.]